jgi:hypothetical protein
MFITVGLGIFAQNNQVEFLEKEKGFITKDGCKILVKRYYGLSENHYYFALESGKNYYYLDTNNVSAFQNIKIGKNKDLACEKHPGFKRGLWVGAVGVGIILVPVGAAFSAFYLDEFSPNIDLYTPGFLILDGVYGYAWFKAFQDAVFNVRLVKAFKTGKPFVCLK